MKKAIKNRTFKNFLTPKLILNYIFITVLIFLGWADKSAPIHLFTFIYLLAFIIPFLLYKLRFNNMKKSTELIFSLVLIASYFFIEGYLPKIYLSLPWFIVTLTCTMIMGTYLRYKLYQKYGK